MNIKHLRLFVRVAATHNISMAGEELGLSAALASSYLNKLEESLGVRLIHRTTRKVSLTAEGQAFLHHAEDVIASVDAAKAAVGVGKLSPSGTLRIAAPASFGRMHLLPELPNFMKKHPDLKIDLKLSDTIIDLVEGGFDVAIRNSELKDSSLIAKKLVQDKRIVCASAEYIKNNGVPDIPEQLLNHNCISLMNLEMWSFKGDKEPLNIKVKGNFRTDNGEAVRDACVNGLGIAVNSTWSVYKQIISGELKQVLADHPLQSEAAIWAVYPSSRQLAPKVRVFIDYFADYFQQNPYWDEQITGHLK